MFFLSRRSGPPENGGFRKKEIDGFLLFTAAKQVTGILLKKPFLPLKPPKSVFLLEGVPGNFYRACEWVGGSLAYIKKNSDFVFFTIYILSGLVHWSALSAARKSLCFHPHPHARRLFQDWGLRRRPRALAGDSYLHRECCGADPTLPLPMLSTVVAVFCCPPGLLGGSQKKSESRQIKHTKRPARRKRAKIGKSNTSK